MTHQDKTDRQRDTQALTKEKLLALLSMRLECSPDSLTFLFSSTDAAERNEDSVIIPDLRFQ